MKDASDYIPFHVPTIGEEEIREVTDTLRSGWLTTGPKTARFEEEFSRYVGAPHALAVNSCTAGLHLALAALGIGPRDEVITTPLTFCATVNTILQTGAAAVLADVDEYGNIDPASIAKRINKRTRAILPVHLAGNPCRMDEIWSLASDHGLMVVEDAAHAAGTRYRGHPIGGGDPEGKRASHAVAFSFYATKNLTTGEGGMVTTHSPQVYETMKTLCLHGISKDAWKRYAKQGNWFYEVTACGFKYNLSDVQSAIGIHQLRKLEAFTETRAQYAAMYNSALEGIGELELPGTTPGGRHAWHLYVLKLNLPRLNLDRAAFIERLREKGVGASVHFIPIPLHRAYAGDARLAADTCPVAMAQYPRMVSLPLYPAMRPEQVLRVADAVKDVVRAGRVKVMVAGSWSHDLVTSTEEERVP
jgi:dTDP-4-amino-4,6-dideoxygalactose transaminase